MLYERVNGGLQPDLANTRVVPGRVLVQKMVGWGEELYFSRS